MSLRKQLKKLGRKVIPIHEKYVTRWARPAVTAAASYLLSPVVGEAFNYGTHHLHQKVNQVTQRAEGTTGLASRQQARAQANRTTMYGHIAAGVSAIASGITTAAMGGNFFTGLAGQGGAKVLGSTATIYGSATAVPAGIANAAVPTVDAAHSGLVMSNVGGVHAFVPAGVGAPVMGGGLATLPPAAQAAAAAAAAGGGGGFWTTLGTTLLTTAATRAISQAAMPQDSNKPAMTFPTRDGGAMPPGSDSPGELGRAGILDAFPGVGGKSKFPWLLVAGGVGVLLLAKKVA